MLWNPIFYKIYSSACTQRNPPKSNRNQIALFPTDLEEEMDVRLDVHFKPIGKTQSDFGPTQHDFSACGEPTILIPYH